MARRQSIGKRVKRRRLAKKMTQEELAKRAGMKQSHVSAIEHDKRLAMTVDTVYKLCKALECKAGDLLD